MSLRYVYNDIDGCIGNFAKPKFPDKQNLSENECELHALQKLVTQLPEITFAVVTGRSVHEADNIIHYLNFSGISLCEMGNVIYQPGEKSYFLYEHLGLCPESMSFLKAFFRWRDDLDIETLAREKFPDSGVKFLKDRLCMMTFEFERNIGRELANWLYTFFFPETVKDAIYKGYLNLVFSGKALDILPFIGKSSAMSYLDSQKQIVLDQTLSIGDSFHSDYDYMKISGYAGCPGNADPQILQIVAEKKDKGYISKKSHAQGNLDIIHHAIDYWL